jgi:hypothetical protein
MLHKNNTNNKYVSKNQNKTTKLLINFKKGIILQMKVEKKEKKNKSEKKGRIKKEEKN